MIVKSRIKSFIKLIFQSFFGQKNLFEGSAIQAILNFTAAPFMNTISMFYIKSNTPNMKSTINAFFAFCLLLTIIACKLEKKEDAPSKPDGKAIYMDRCTSCHGMDGKMGFGGAKDITQTMKSLDEIIHQVTNGKGAMAPYKNILTPEEIYAVSEYALSLNKK